MNDMTQDYQTSVVIPGYSDENGCLLDHQVDSVCLHYAGGNSTVAMQIKLVAGDIIQKNPELMDGRELSEVSHPSLRNNNIVMQVLAFSLSLRLYDPTKPEQRQEMQEVLQEQLNLSTDKDLSNPHYTDKNGHLLAEPLHLTCRAYTARDEQAAGYFQQLVGNFIQTRPAIADIRQVLDSYTPRQRLTIYTLNKVAQNLTAVLNEDPAKISEIFADDTRKNALQTATFSLLDLAYTEGNGLNQYTGINLPKTEALIGGLFDKGTESGYLGTIESAKITIKQEQEAAVKAQVNKLLGKRVFQ